MKTPIPLLIFWALFGILACYKEIPDVTSTLEIINDSLIAQGNARRYVDAIETSNFQYVTLGTIAKNNSVFIHLEKRNRHGALLWEAKIGNGQNDAFALCETLDGEIVIAGYEGDKGILFKTTADGEVFTSLPATVGSEDSEFRDVARAPNGDIFALARVGSPGAAGIQVLRLRSTAGLDLVEIDRYPLDLGAWVASPYKWSLDASQTGFVSIAGAIHAPLNSNPTNGILIQINVESGQETLHKTYSGQETLLNDVVTLSNGNAFAVGSKINGEGIPEIYLVNACKTTGCSWDRPLPSTRPAEAQACVGADNGQVAVAGKRFVDNANSVAHFFRVSEDGAKIEAAHDYGGRSATESEGLNSLFRCKDEGWLMTGSIEVSPSPAYLLKTDKNGNIN